MTDDRVKSLIVAYKCSSCKRTLFRPYQQICGFSVEDAIKNRRFDSQSPAIAKVDKL